MRCGFALSSREAHRSLSDGVENRKGLCRQQQRAFASTQRLSCHRLAVNSSLNTIYFSCSLVCSVTNLKAISTKILKKGVATGFVIIVIRVSESMRASPE